MQRHLRRHGAFSARPGSNGLTLVELLVAIVVLGFIMTLVSQAVFQVSQITRVADATTRKLASRWAEGWTLQDTLANLAAPMDADNKVFEGTSRQIKAYTTMSVTGEATGVQRFELELRTTDTAPVGTEVWATTGASAPGTAGWQIVARLPGRIEWVFVDRRQQIQAVWPPVGANARDPDSEDLPSAVALRRADGAMAHWYPFAGETTRPAPPGKMFWEQ